MQYILTQLPVKYVKLLLADKNSIFFLFPQRETGECVQKFEISCYMKELKS